MPLQVHPHPHLHACDIIGLRKTPGTSMERLRCRPPVSRTLSATTRGSSLPSAAGCTKGEVAWCKKKSFLAKDTHKSPGKEKKKRLFCQYCIALDCAKLQAHELLLQSQGMIEPTAFAGSTASCQRSWDTKKRQKGEVCVRFIQVDSGRQFFSADLGPAAR